MGLLKRIALTWKMAKAIPNLEFWQGALPRLEALSWAIPQKLDTIDAFIPKLDALERVLSHLESMEGRIPQSSVIEALSARLVALNETISKVETLAYPIVNPEPVKTVQPAPKPPRPDLTQKHEWDRLKMLAKFCQLEGKAREIEQEWQRIQQDENDAYFAIQTMDKGNPKEIYLYKKGIAEGIKWCVNRFC